MRCLNCHAVAMETDRKCLACGAPLTAASYRKPEAVKPFFAIIFMVVGAVVYNTASPPSQAVAKARGGINMEHAFGAGIVGAICAVIGGAFDALLGRRK